MRSSPLSSGNFQVNRVWGGLAVIFQLLSSAVFAEDIAGDLAPRNNPDGLIDVADFVVLQRIVNGEITATSSEALTGDVAPLGSPDGLLNAGDLVVLQRAILGLVVLDSLPGDVTPPVLAGPLVETISNTQIDVTHLSATDDIAIAGYDYFLDGNVIATTAIPGYSFTGLTPGQGYLLNYRAFDAATPANYSTLSTDLQVQTTAGDTVPPVASSIIATGISETEISITEIQVATDDVAVDHQELEVSIDGINGWTQISADIVFPVTRTVAAAGTREYYRVVAEDTSANRTTGTVIDGKSFATISFEFADYASTENVATAVTVLRSDAEGNSGAIAFELMPVSGDTNYTADGLAFPTSFSIADGLSSVIINVLPGIDLDPFDELFVIGINPLSLPPGVSLGGQSSASFTVQDLDVPPVLDLTNYTLIQDHDFGVTIQNETDTANQLPLVDDALGWVKTGGVAALTPNVGTAPSGTPATQVTTTSGATQWEYISYPVSIDGVLPYDLSIEFKAFDTLEIWVMHPSASTPIKKIIINDLDTTNPTFQRWTMAAAGVIWREAPPPSQTPDWQRAPVALGNDWYRAMIRFQTEELGISDWAGTEIRLYHNRLQTEQPVEYGLVSFAKHPLAQLYKHYATRFPFDLGYGDTINNEWERYRDNNNHAITGNRLELIANLITLSNGGIESGIIAGRLRLFRGESFIVETRGKLASGSGAWGALSWLIESAALPGFPRNPPNAEIDLVEAVDGDQPNQGENVFTTHSSIHNGIIGATDYSIMNNPSDLYDQNKYTPDPQEDWSADYHTWAAEVTQTHVTLFKDGVALKRTEYDSNTALGFETRSNQAVGGQWPGDPVDPGIFPLTLEIDYEKIWRSSDNLAIIATPINLTDVALNTVLTSAPVAVSGFTGSKIVQISPGGKLSVNGNLFTSNPQTVVAGDAIEIQRLSPLINGVGFTVTLTVGTASAQWTIATPP